MSLIEIERRFDVEVLWLANPPLNALDEGLRAALDAALDRALDDLGVRCIVIAADGADFCAGQAEGQGAPDLSRLCNRIEDAPKPVIVALHGAVLGDGMELALAAHYRLAQTGFCVGLPGVRLGLPPAAGATQRLPRLCGAGPALSLLLGGKTRGDLPGFLDAAPSDDVLGAALELAAGDLAPRPTRERIEGLSDPAGFMAATARAREASAGSPLLAPRQIVDCVEGAILLPFESGLAMERAAFEDCRVSDASRALHHIARAEAQARVPPGAPGAAGRDIQRIAIVGGTERAGELALVCLDAGLEVLLVELDPTGQAAVLERLLDLYDTAVEAGRLSAQERDTRLLRIDPDADFEDLAHVDAVWEAVQDDAELKDEVWGAIGLLAQPDTLLLAGGDVMPLHRLNAACGRAGAVIGLNLPGAAHLGTLAELVLPEHAAPEAVTGALALAGRLERIALLAQDRPGRIVHRLGLALERAIEHLLIAGLTGEEIDLALTGYGFRHAPCARLDSLGLDRVLAHRRAVAGEGDGAAGKGETPLSLFEALVDSGLTGREAGAGLLAWSNGTPAGEPPEARAVMQILAEDRGIAPMDRDQVAIADLCAAALANEGARMIEDGAVRRAGDIDVAAVHALGFPRWRGGPMMAADLRGLVSVEKDIATLDGETQVSPLFSELIKNGSGFSRMAG